MRLDTTTGIIEQAQFIQSPNCDEREQGMVPEVIIVHCISLPPGKYDGESVEQFFCNQLDCRVDPYFDEIKHLEVSSHFYLRRDGRVIQFVPTDKRAWHAGESVCLGRPKVNNFSIGIELEGLDTDPDGFTDAQYQALTLLSKELISAYPQITKQRLFAHSDIAPTRKTDPGAYFDWSRLINAL